MGDLRNSFITKDFVINSNIVKCINKIDITLNEFLLILYFINVSLNLDIEDIKEKLGFDEDTVMETFSSLLEKKYIEVVVKNKKDEVIEQINLDAFYDRLALNKKTEDKSVDIYALFEREFGRILSSYEYDLINKWLENGVSEDTIKEALKEAILNNVHSFKYIDKIIYEWSKNGIKKRIKANEDNDDQVEVFDYNWLEDNE